ncbi:hypothetical protein BLNAU_20762 [Blattamonas nauphoetae]|uniref:Uncharacterized protein n=1 Tax=Blattamonas nauphoetae TaxID=2049346 RepID=A0ABQ9WXX2_9EUKA|nr:hypothetical protein BLNAU_20762 [Blattamonas nauphoetae]
MFTLIPSVLKDCTYHHSKTNFFGSTCLTNQPTNFRSHLSTYLKILVDNSCNVFSITPSTHSNAIDTRRNAYEKLNSVHSFQMTQSKQEKMDPAEPATISPDQRKHGI